ncbi:MAG: hypothetical protein WC492_04050 [Candidatus Micrarchaeia archaeon]
MMNIQTLNSIQKQNKFQIDSKKISHQIVKIGGNICVLESYGRRPVFVVGKNPIKYMRDSILLPWQKICKCEGYSYSYDVLTPKEQNDLTTKYLSTNGNSRKSDLFFNNLLR